MLLKDRWAGKVKWAKFGTGKYLVGEKYLALLDGCGQHSGEFMCKKDVVASGVGCALQTRAEIAAWELIQSFNIYSGM